MVVEAPWVGPLPDEQGGGDEDGKLTAKGQLFAVTHPLGILAQTKPSKLKARRNKVSEQTGDLQGFKNRSTAVNMGTR